MEERLKIENGRTEETLGKIYFYKDGNSPWYRAYELSAYYASHFDNGLKETEKLHAQRKPSKVSEEGIMQVGLQLNSFKKYFPNIDVSNMTESAFCIDISLDKYKDITLSNYKDKCLEWKNQFDVKKSDKKQKDNNVSKTIYSSPTSFSMIMKEIVRYNTNNRTENELIQFIYTLKEMCAELI